MVRLDGPGSGIVFHGGGMDGASTVILVVPAHRLVVVGLSSTMVDLPGRAGAKIIHRLVPGTRFEHELRGTILADIGLDDPLRPYRLRFHLSPTDTNRLAGPVSAWTFREGRAPDILPGYATLHRDGGSAPPRIAPAGARGL
jgi:hypothetical protein